MRGSTKQYGVRDRKDEISRVGGWAVGGKVVKEQNFGGMSFGTRRFIINGKLSFLHFFLQ